MCISIFFAIAAHDVVFRYRHASIDPNARTMEEAYRIDYSPSQVDAGRNVVTSKVERFSVADPEENIQILVLDGNEDVCFKRKGELSSKICSKGFRAVPFPAFENEISVFINTKAKSIILKHKPLCIAADIRPVIGSATQLKRGHTVAALSLIVRRLSGVDPNEGPCPFEATDAAEYVHGSLHLGLRLRAATFRQAVTPSSVNAYTDTNLAMTPNDPTYPLGEIARIRRNMRNASPEDRRYLSRQTTSARVQVRNIIDDAACCATQAGDGWLDRMPGIFTSFQ